MGHSEVGDRAEESTGYVLRVRKFWIIEALIR
jgi:hypothetical protein